MKNLALALAALSLAFPAYAQDDFRAFGIAFGQPLDQVHGVLFPENKDTPIFQVEPEVPNSLLSDYFVYVTEDEQVCKIVARGVYPAARALNAAEVLQDELKRKYPTMDELFFQYEEGHEGRSKDQAFLDGGGSLLAFATNELPSPLSEIMLSVTAKREGGHDVMLTYQSDAYACAGTAPVVQQSKPTAASGL